MYLHVPRGALIPGPLERQDPHRVRQRARDYPLVVVVFTGMASKMKKPYPSNRFPSLLYPERPDEALATTQREVGSDAAECL